MSTSQNSNQFFHNYFSEWIKIYKLDAVRPVTYQKYLMTLQRLTELAVSIRICDLDKRSYQNLINEYAQTHEKQTTMDFHHHLKSAILDAIDEGLLSVDPTRKVVIKGKPPSEKKSKFLSQHEVKLLLSNLNLADKPNWDWFILLVAKTGMRFSEALALTPADFDFEEQKIKITKTWNYKCAEGGFGETKNPSSRRTLQIDYLLTKQILNLTRGVPADNPIFVDGRVFNSTVNNRLEKLCNIAKVPVISMHSLRHSHASALIFAGVSIASIAKRLGHSSVTTTQETYLHIIQELENQDSGKISQYLDTLM